MSDPLSEYRSSYQSWLTGSLTIFSLALILFGLIFVGSLLSGMNELAAIVLFFSIPLILGWREARHSLKALNKRIADASSGK